MSPAVGVADFMATDGLAAFRIDDDPVAANDATEIRGVMLDDFKPAAARSLGAWSNLAARRVNLIYRQRVFQKLATIGMIEFRGRSFGGPAIIQKAWGSVQNRFVPLAAC